MHAVASAPQAAGAPDAGRLKPEHRLAPLRDDIRIIEGARSLSGDPTWTIVDPVRNRFFQIGERDFFLLCAWRESVVRDIAARYQALSGDPLTMGELESMVQFLQQGELLDGAIQTVRERLVNRDAARQQSIWQQILHKYLFFRVPLVRPDRQLDWLYGRVRFLFRPWFPRLAMVFGVLGLLLILRSPVEFLGSFSWFFSVTGFVVFALTLTVVKIIHELGHALMCKHYGLRVPTMGVAFLVMWPVLYTDASDSWRLTSRRQRAMISAAGVGTELMIACYAMFFWAILPDGLARSVAFAMATTTWITSVAVNLNPLMRFDGYYFMSDLLNIPNLQDRSFALGRWRLRRILFGQAGPRPEHFEPRLQRGVIILAWSIWVYRFFLFLGIAVLVYHLFFKALGIFLFFVEIWWFIVRPIRNEIKEWPDLARQTSTRRRLFWASLLGALLLLVLVPWRSTVVLPAVMTAERFERIYPGAEGVVAEIRVQPGESVEAGQVLARLVSPELDHALALAQSDQTRLRTLLERSAADSELFEQRLILEQGLARADAEVQGLLRARERLELRAPFAGQVRDMHPEMHAGRWVGREDRLMTLVAPGRVQVQAWVSEDDLELIGETREGRFHGRDVALTLTLIDIASSAVKSLQPVYHASLHGGDVAVREQDGQLQPVQALYQVTLRGEAESGEWAMPVRQRGWVYLQGERRSLMGRSLRWMLAALIRESGF